MSEQCNRGLLPDRAMRALLIVVPAPSLHLLPSIFWALDMLVNQPVADKVAHEGDRRNGIANLVVAGERLCDDMAERF